MTGPDDTQAAKNAPAVLSLSLGQKVTTTPILVVGAGGIGCELLKNLVLSGFKKITVVCVYNIGRGCIYRNVNIVAPPNSWTPLINYRSSA